MNVNALPTPADLPQLEEQLAELRTALEASAERVKSSNGTVHALTMSHSDLLGRFHDLRARVEHLRNIEPLVRVGVASPPLEAVMKYGRLPKLGELYSDFSIVHEVI